MEEINLILNNCLKEFSDFFDLEKLKNKKSFKWENYELEQRIKNLNAAQNLDETGLTTFMILRAYVELYLKEHAFLAYDLITNWQEESKELAKMSRLYAMLENPIVLEEIETYHDHVKNMLAHYQYENTDNIGLLLNNKWYSAFIRRDALASMDKLEVHQFMQGKAAEKDLKIHSNVYEFWNINSLVYACANQSFDGIALCLIRDPNKALNSFFCISIKSGETITILTDRQKVPHPAFNDFNRRPDRDMQVRAEENWFPYDLLDLKESDDGKFIYAEERNQLVPINKELIILCKLSELRIQEIVWLGLLFERINETYGKKNLLSEKISYTAQMIKTPSALIDSLKDSALVKRETYEFLEMPELTANDVTADKLKNQLTHDPIGINSWLMLKFKDQIPDQVYNLESKTDVKLLTEKNKSLLKSVKQNAFFEPKESFLDLKTFTPLNFGTKEELEKDRLWIARLNQASVVNKLAHEDFEKRHKEIEAWYQSKLEENAEFIIDLCVKGECVLTHHPVRQMFGDHKPFKRDIMTQVFGNDMPSRGFYSYFLAETDIFKSKWLCATDGYTTATVLTFIQPHEASHAAFLCGMNLEDMPEEIQHWGSEDPYVGNHILQRLDPEDWEIQNPWRNLNMNVSIALSKSFFNKRRKELNLPKLTINKKSSKQEE